MTEKEVKQLLLTVSSQYQSFKVDDYVVKEWLNYCKDYSKEDVELKYRQHLVGDYKDRIPNIAYMTKYLVRINDKDKAITIRCQLCGEAMLLKDYDKHYARESSVNYIEKQALKYFNKPIDRTKYLEMNEEEFDERYTKLLTTIKDLVPTDSFYGTSEKEAIEKALWH